MKKLLFLITILPISVFSQTEKNNPNYGNYIFNNTERKVSWVKVIKVDSSINPEIIKEYFIKNRIFKFENNVNSELYGDLLKTKIDARKYGVSFMNEPFVFQNDFIGNVFLEIKPGRYRVTINKIRWVNNGNTDIITKAIVGYSAPTAKGNEESIDGTFSFRDDGIVRTRIKLMFEIIDKHFNDLFQYKVNSISKDDF
ncbi:MAG: hypothetical protein ACKOWQ_01280 [Aquirufa sp.]